MPKAIQVSIKEPCHENWQNMTPNQQGRHCMACQKTVVDFTDMSDKEILAYMSKATSSVCGRFDNHQLDRNLTRPPIKKRFSFAYAWSVMTATFLITGTAKAQGLVRLKGKVKVEEKVAPVKLKPAVMGMILPNIILNRPLNGMVLDQKTLQPVIGASLKIKGTELGRPTGEDGSFRFDNLTVGNEVELEISSIGYETQTIPLGRTGNGKDLQILLSPVAEELDPVVVIGYSDSRRCYRLGGAVGIIYKDTITEKVKKVFNDWVPAPFKNNGVKIFPNPQRPGSTLNISLQLKETGEYKMELMDASGRVVYVQPLQINSKEQTATLPTNSTWSTGVYYVRITGHNIKNIYQSKVLLQ